MAKSIEKNFKKIPETETIWVKSINNKDEYFITSDIQRTEYYLYIATPDGYKRISIDKTPADFDRIIFKK